MKRLLIVLPLFLTGCISFSDDHLSAGIRRIRAQVASDEKISDADKQIIESTEPTTHRVNGLAPAYFTWSLPGGRTAVVDIVPGNDAENFTTHFSISESRK